MKDYSSTSLMIEKALSSAQKQELLQFLEENPKADLLSAYLFSLETRKGLQPVLFPLTKTIYASREDALRLLGEEGKLWRETEIRITYHKEAVNEETKKIYICPFSGKVFGDNTHPNPQDAIYDWVSTCPENTERSGGLKAKRFFVSDDPEVIKNYIKPIEKPIMKRVFSSYFSGKLFNSKEAVIREFVALLRPFSLVEALGQNRWELESHFLAALQAELGEEAVAAFVEELSHDPLFEEHVRRWMGEQSE